MGKVFVHRPLKRQDLRRLSEPPKPAEAAPGPSVRPDEARIVAKLEAIREQFRLDRARKRAEQREAERLVATAVDKFVSHYPPTVIDGAAFIRWLLETMQSVEDEAEFARGCNLLTLTANMECLVCGEPDPVQAGQCSIIVFTGMKDGDPDMTVAAVACPSCMGAKPRYYARMLIHAIALGPRPDMVKRLRKLKLFKHDWDLLRWLTEPRAGDDERAIARLVNSGVGAEIMLRVERWI